MQKNLTTGYYAGACLSDSTLYSKSHMLKQRLSEFFIMRFNPFEEKPMPLDQLFMDWDKLYPKPYHLGTVHPYTKVRIVLMNGTEFEAQWFGHQFSRHCQDNDLRRELAMIRRIEQMQQKRISCLKPKNETILEHTITYEQLAVDLTAFLARRESDCNVKTALDFALLEDFDHLYRYADLLEMEQYDRLVRSMARLNAHAAEAVSKCPEIHACTDVTGFGLLGHADEMARGSGVTIRLYSRRLPLLPGALEFAEMGIIPAGAYRNLDYVKPRLTVAESVQQARVDLISDPQTSGGLLVALPMEDAGALLAALRERDPDSAIIGAVVAQTEHTLEIV